MRRRSSERFRAGGSQLRWHGRQPDFAPGEFPPRYDDPGAHGRSAVLWLRRSDPPLVRGRPIFQLDLGKINVIETISSMPACYTLPYLDWKSTYGTYGTAL